MSVRAESHPQPGASLIASRKQTSQPDRSAAPAQCTRPGARIGDSGTAITVSTVATAVVISGIQNSQW